jgi:hypothetical protein
MKAAAFQGRGSELNCGGMALTVDVALSIGDQISVEFTPASAGEPITVRCFVRNGQGSRYGLEFIAENDADYGSVSQIESVLRTMESSNYGLADFYHPET